MTGYQVACDECGWTSTRTHKTEALANYAYRQHSCRKWRRRQAAKLRRMRARAKIDRTPKPCLHKNTRHEHGTHACYVLDACRCYPCMKANRDYERNRSRRNAYGRNNLTHANPVREHINTLTAAGVGLKTIAKRSGVAHGSLWKLMYGKTRPDGTRVPSRRVLKTTAAALLALKPYDPRLHADGARIPSIGTARRLQALATLGWSINRLATELDTDRQALDQAMRGGIILARTARIVAAGYHRLWNTRPPQTSHHERVAASRTRNHAARAGYAPPLAWDDDTIDNPEAKPLHNLRAGEHDEQRAGIDEAAVLRRIEGDPLTATDPVICGRCHLAKPCECDDLTREGQL